MSYEPMLLISKEDLHKNEQVIEDYLKQKRPKKISEKLRRELRAYEELNNYLTLEGTKLKNIVIICWRPEGSQFNSDVRNLMHELNIEFAINL